MNKIKKVILATLGGFDLIWSMFIPIAIAVLILMNFTELTILQKWLIGVSGSLSSLYRGVVIWLK